MNPEPNEHPTQVRRPRAAVARTLVAAFLGLLPLIPEIVKLYGLDSIPWVASAAALAATTTKVLAMPGVEKWLSTYAPWLSAGGTPPDRKEE